MATDRYEDEPYRRRYSPAPPFWLRLYPLLLVVVIAAVGFLLWRSFHPAAPDLFDRDAAPRPVTPRGDLSEAEKATISIFRRASPSVVNVINVALERDLFRRNVLEIPRGSGSGFVWDAQGYIVTNAHVVEGGDAFKVTLADRSTYDAFLVGDVPEQDVAVLRAHDVPAAKLLPVDIGTSADLQVGQKVFAIGNPFGLDQTLTDGIISGLGREIRGSGNFPIRGVIQTDAAINPGNSGGPLLDSAGRVIGMNTAIFSTSGSSAGIGFAVPIDTVNRLVPQIIRQGRRPRAGLGVTTVAVQEVSADGLPDGVIIVDVYPRSAAAKAGLRPTTRRVLGDIIVAVDGEKIRTSDDLMAALGEKEVGQRVTITVVRDGREMQVATELQALR